MALVTVPQSVDDWNYSPITYSPTQSFYPTASTAFPQPYSSFLPSSSYYSPIASFPSTTLPAYSPYTATSAPYSAFPYPAFGSSYPTLPLSASRNPLAPSHIRKSKYKHADSVRRIQKGSPWDTYVPPQERRKYTAPGSAHRTHIPAHRGFNTPFGGPSTFEFSAPSLPFLDQQLPYFSSSYSSPFATTYPATSFPSAYTTSFPSPLYSSSALGYASPSLLGYSSPTLLAGSSPFATPYSGATWPATTALGAPAFPYQPSVYQPF